MLSIETETRVAKLFVNLFEGEKSLETARKLLADKSQFDAYHIFTSLDRENKNHIDEYNIVDFLKYNNSN